MINKAKCQVLGVVKEVAATVLADSRHSMRKRWIAVQSRLRLATEMLHLKKSSSTEDI